MDLAVCFSLSLSLSTENPLHFSILSLSLFFKLFWSVKESGLHLTEIVQQGSNLLVLLLHMGPLLSEPK